MNLEFLKQNLSFFFVVFFSVIIFSSCSKTPPSLSVIPSEASMVASIDVFSIASKSRLDKLSELEIVKEAITKFGGATDKSKIGGFFKQILGNPLNSGVDFTEDIYVFNTSNDIENQLVGTSISLTDRNEFNTFISGLSSKQNVDIAIETANDNNFVRLEKRLHIAWDDDKAVVLHGGRNVSSDSIRTMISSLMNLPVEDQISSEKSFKEHHKEKKDLSIWVSANLFSEEFIYKRIQDQTQFDIKDVSASANLEFKDDQIQFTMEVFPSEALQAVIDQSEELIIPFNKEVAGLFSDNYKGLITFAIDPAKVAETYATYKSDGDLNESRNRAAAFGGSFLIDMYDLEVYAKTKHDFFNNSSNQSQDVMPKFALGFDVNNRSIIDTLINHAVDLGVCVAKNNYYIGSYGREFSFAFGVNDKFGLVSADEGCIQQFVNGEKLERTIQDAKEIDNIGEFGWYSFLKLDVEEYSDEFQEFVESKDFTPKKTGITAYKKLFKSVEIKKIKSTKWEVDLNFKYSDENVLQDLIKVTNQIYVEVM